MMTKKVTFTLAAEIAAEASKALLLGEFNNWLEEEGILLKKQKDGSFKGTVELEAGKSYQYRYLLDGERWENDGEAAGYFFIEEFGIDNCVIMVEAPVAPVAKKAAKVAAPKKAAKAAPKAEAPKAAVPKPPAKIVADDLTKIEGIGKKIAELLVADGISDFSLLSKATPKKIKTILEAAGNRFSMHDPATWPKQAKLAAAGKWEELKVLQAELKGGK